MLQLQLCWGVHAWPKLNQCLRDTKYETYLYAALCLIICVFICILYQLIFIYISWDILFPCLPRQQTSVLTKGITIVMFCACVGNSFNGWTSQKNKSKNHEHTKKKHWCILCFSIVNAQSLWTRSVDVCSVFFSRGHGGDPAFQLPFFWWEGKPTNSCVGPICTWKNTYPTRSSNYVTYIKGPPTWIFHE